MSWILDGKKVRADYLGIAVVGTVTDSRVKYGGKVQYTLKLDEAIRLPWSTEKRTVVLVDCDELKEFV